MRIAYVRFRALGQHDQPVRLKQTSRWSFIGEAADDADLDFAAQSFSLGGTLVPAGSLLFVNGKTGAAEIYALDKNIGAIIATPQ